MTWRPLVLHTPSPLSGLHLFKLGERDYAPVMPFVVDHTGRLIQQQYAPRPDRVSSAVLIGPGITNQHALITWHWLGTRTHP